MGGKRKSPRSSKSSALTRGNTTKLTDNHLLTLTKEQLRVECRKHGQKTSGNKFDLLQRLGQRMATGVKRKDVANTIPVTTNGSATVGNGRLGGGMATKATVSKDAEYKEALRHERESLVLWKKPFVTTQYFVKEVVTLLCMYGTKILVYRKSVASVLITILGLYLLVKSAGPHEYIVQRICKKLLWCFYWTGLGILSSVGLGTGLHTFLLYLGPHIAQVTLAAYECESLNFPEPPYPDEIICPSEKDSLGVTILSIMSKVRLEAMCWGAGTALGELPPYFMAKAARLSGVDPDEEDDDLKEFETLQHKQSRHEELTFIERGKLFIEEVVQKVGFFGILACASIPNPLFDLAGITCGHFLVPFWTFFGATLIGKAIIKMHIQKLFVIIAFNEALIVAALDRLAYVPIVGDKLQAPFKAFLAGQKQRLHKTTGGGGIWGKKEAEVSGGSNVLGSLFEKFVVAMILYFVVSIVNSFAQSYHKRLHKKKVIGKD